jgi:F-type H+-transporting ATPase subunit a
MLLLGAESDPLGHVKDKVLLEVGGTPVVTMHMLMLMVAALVLLAFMSVVARSIGTGSESEGNERFITKGRFSQMIEVIIVALRDQMLRPLLGEHLTKTYLPYLMSLFFFILFCNLLGLVPLLDLQHLIGGSWGNTHWAIVGGTATANLAINGGLATIAFIVIQAHGIRELGLGGWLHHLLGGAPVWLAPIMVPVELLGMFIKPAALTIRLFANMVAGHTLMAVLFTFGLMAVKGTESLIAGGTISILSMAFATAIYFLEIFIAFLQAFIFMFLTAVFISQLSHHGEFEPEVTGGEGYEPERRAGATA